MSEDTAGNEPGAVQRVERLAAVLYGNPDHWCRGTGMNRSYWRRKARAQITSDPDYREAWKP